MPVIEREARDRIVRVCHLMYEKGWVAANDGNVSVRLDGQRVLCTPTRMSKGMVRADDLIIVNMQGKKIEGHNEGTSEIAMHLKVYSMRPDVHGVAHAHPPVSTGFASAGRSLNLALLPEVIIGLGCVSLAGYGLPGTPALTDAMESYIPRYDALLMANHGVVSYGPDVLTAFHRMETVEHFARITLVAELLGGARPLPRSEVEKLFESRARYGVDARTGFEPGCPVPLEEMPLVEDAPGETPDRITVTRQELIGLVEQALRNLGR